MPYHGRKLSRVLQEVWISGIKLTKEAKKVKLKRQKNRERTIDVTQVFIGLLMFIKTRVCCKNISARAAVSIFNSSREKKKLLEKHCMTQ